ncbi:hypothetical protein TSAR_007916 [Trichomalopsis sarcophagae]|uniref:CCHC-type domain-containing protein n=1 Tax=Trichomalopsis sarcophagae TaxID=543379 RepID=A0A232FMJ9_9HYME|nr:hypothetical protein TSAR_007916 [Trichomalopsis sarcophagae]
MLLFGSVEKALHYNMMSCSMSVKMWTKIQTLYGDSSVDAKQYAWEKFYSFRINEQEPVAGQLEQFQCIIQKLNDASDKPSDTCVLNKLLSSLPAKFSYFRFAWKWTPEAEKKTENLISRCSVVACASRAKIFNKRHTQEEFEKDIAELKKGTRCGICIEKGHWAHECPKKAADNESSKNAVKLSVLICDIVETYRCASDTKTDLWIAGT